MEWPQILYERFISKPIIRYLTKGDARFTPIFTANEITAFNFFLIMTFGVYAFAIRQYYLGLFFCLINGFLDYLDGDLARATNKKSAVGDWLDIGGDVIIQNSIMAAIAYGLLVHGFATPILPAAIMLYFVGNAAMNLISFHYNDTFGFTSHTGSQLFRKYMDTKPHMLNRFLKNLIDPTASYIGTFFYTVRYFIVIGVFWNMTIAFYMITGILTFRWISMYIIYALYLAKYKKLWLIQALLIMDENQEEYYAIRNR